MGMPHHIQGKTQGLRGFSLIELLVSMAIALVVTLAITTVMIQGEGSRRSTASVSEVNQTGAYVAYAIDRQLRSAGSGFAQRWGDGFGCAISASKSGTAILPRGTDFPAPFAAAPHTQRLAPVLIQADGADSGSDVRGDLVTVMAGTAGVSESPPLVQTSSVTGSASAGSLALPNTLGFANGDLVLLADSTVADGCLLEQVSDGGALPPPRVALTSSPGLLPLAGTYYTQNGTGISLSSFGNSTYAIHLGNVPTNPPQFLLYGVGDNRTLFSYDMLATGGTDAPVPIADGVVEMRALYGLDTTNPPDGTLDTWVLPDAAGYDAATLSNGSAASRTKLRQIVAIRLGFILRTSLKEKDAVATNTTLTLFGDLDASLHRTRALAGDDLNYRFRTVEVTVPLRNVLLAPQSPL